MLRSIKSLMSFSMGATDGEIGKVKDIYFDDEKWTVRNLIVETSNWLFGRKVLISPMALRAPDWKAKVFPVNLSKNQIKNSPVIDTERPVSRQQEIELYEHYNWPYYGIAGYGGIMPIAMINTPQSLSGESYEEKESKQLEDNSDPHLRSVKHISDYSIHGIDGDIGEVTDLLVDDINWEIQYMVIETGNWFVGKQILIPVKKINKIDWDSSSVHVNQTIDSLKSSPLFDNNLPVEEEFERIKYHYLPD